MTFMSIALADDVTPEDIAAVDKVLQHLESQNRKTLLASLANWLLALRIYKNLEPRYARMEIAPASLRPIALSSHPSSPRARTFFRRRTPFPTPT